MHEEGRQLVFGVNFLNTVVKVLTSWLTRQIAELFFLDAEWE